MNMLQFIIAKSFIRGKRQKQRYAKRPILEKLTRLSSETRCVTQIAVNTGIEILCYVVQNDYLSTYDLILICSIYIRTCRSLQ